MSDPRNGKATAYERFKAKLVEQHMRRVEQEDPQLRSHGGTGTPWTEEELALLRAEAALMLPLSRIQLAERLARRLGRTLASVQWALDYHRIWTAYRHERDVPQS